MIGSASEAQGREVATRFLSENELPDYARLNSVTGLDDEMLPPEALAPIPNPNASATAAAAASASASSAARPPVGAAVQDGRHAAAVDRLMRQFVNVPRENVQRALESSQWNEQEATAKILQQMVQSINPRSQQPRH